MFICLALRVASEGRGRCVGHALAVSIFQILRFLSSSLFYLFFCVCTAVSSGEPKGQVLAVDSSLW